MKTYPMSQSAFDALRTRLLEAGVTLPDGYFGTLEYRGIKLKYSFDGEKLTLSVQQKPFLIPAGEIWKVVDGWVSGTTV
jgi:hypothetical protein